MLVSVVVCTWNRAALLRNALESIAVSVADYPGEVQVIVVNYNCTDHTDDVVAELRSRLPITLVHERRPGLSHARNAGIAAAHGDYVIWTDDDTIVDARWVAAYASAFATHPDAAFFGGPIRPLFEAVPPPWLMASLPRIGSIYACRDLGPAPFRIEHAEQLPYGANFATRMAEQKQLNYDPRLGRQPQNYWLGRDESEMLLKLLDRGADGVWVPEAAVSHWIPRERQTLGYVLRHGYGVGQTAALLKPDSRVRLFGKPAWLWRAFAARWSCALGLRVCAGPDRWVSAAHQAAAATGRLFYRYKKLDRP